MTIIILSTSLVFGQDRPFITGFTPGAASPGETVILTGFNLPTANFKITIGGVEATSSGTPAANSISFIMPTGAPLSVITILDETSRLSGSSSEKIISLVQSEDFTTDGLSTETVISGTGAELYDFIIADFNNDGKTDVVSTDNASEEINVFTNTTITPGTITFNTASITNEQGRNNLHGATADLDGDGLEDLVITRGGSSNTSFYVFRNTSTVGSNISFQSPTVFNLPTLVTPDGASIRFVKRIDLKDIDNDGKKDVVVNSSNSGRVFIYLNTSSAGSISLQASPAEITVDLSSDELSLWGLEAKDLNNDGLTDLILTNNDVNGKVYILKNTSISGSVSFQDPILLSTVFTPLNLAVVDLNGDQLDEIIVIDRIANEIGIHKNISNPDNGEIQFETTIDRFSAFTSGGQPWGIDVGDINGDGKIDIVTSNAVNASAAVLINTSSGGDISLTNNDITASAASRNIKLVDLDSDGKPEILLASRDGADLIIKNNSFCHKPVLPTLSPDLTKLCGGTSQTIGTFAVAGSNYSWESSPPLSSPSFTATGDTDPMLTVSTEGVYRLRVTTADCDEVSNELRFTGTVAPIPASPAVSGLPGTICQGDDVSLSVTAMSGLSYFFVSPTQAETESTVLDLTNIKPSESGDYDVYAVDDNTICRSNPTTINVLVNAIPSIIIATDEDTVFCEGLTASLETETYADFDYAWLTNGTANGNTNKSSFTLDATGNYQLRITDPISGCSSESNIVGFRELIKPVVSIEAPDSSCINTATAFSAITTAGEDDVAITYTWDFMDGGASRAGESLQNTFTTAQDFDVALTAAYTDLPSCENEASKTVTVVTIPSTEIAVTNPAGASVSGQKCPSDTVSLAIVAGLSNYIWTSSSNADTIARTNNIEIITPGTYTVTAVNSFQCTINESVDITDLANSGLDISYQGEIVNDQTITLNQNDLDVMLSADRGSTYQWEPTALFENPTEANTLVYPRQNVDISLKGLDSNGCLDSTGVSIIDLRVLEEKALSLSGFNGDNCWEISNTSSLADNGCSIEIFDNKGKNILSTLFENLNNNEQDCVWNGEAAGSPVKPGIYYFIIKCNGGGDGDSGSIIVLQ